MSQKLSAVVRKLNGVSIRANGGAYWLPEKSAAPWLALVEAFKKAGLGRFDRLDRIREALPEASAPDAHRDVVVGAVRASETT